MKKIIILLLLSTLSFSDEIKGAFNIGFGDVFDTKSAISTQETYDGYTLYEYEPTKKVNFFNRYHLLITPKTHKVYEIHATGEKSYACPKI